MTEQRDTTQPLVLGLGEILWDVFPDGPRFGGAPANFACNFAGLAGLSARVAMVSAVGDDPLGHKALEALTERHVSTDGIATSQQPTGTVLVTLDAAGHAGYEFAEHTAWDNLVWHDSLDALAHNASAVCFGTLGQRSAVSRETIRRFVRETPERCLRVLDINLRPPYWSGDVVLASLQMANVLKLNEDELSVVAELLSLTGSEIELLGLLVERFRLKAAVMTRGAHGAVLMSEGQVSEHPGRQVNVIDTVGAGDSFTATVVLGLLRGLPLDRINAWAGVVAAWVCSQPGATPAIPDHLRLPG